MAIKPYDYDDARQAAIEVKRDYEGMSEDDAAEAVQDQDIYDTLEVWYDDDRDNAKAIIDKYDLYFYHVTIEPGYYDGLQIMIENNFPIAFDDYREKREAQKEITRIRSMLEELAGCGYVSTYPGWCMGYADYEGTLADIAEAIKDMRSEAAFTPTCYTYNKCYA